MESEKVIRTILIFLFVIFITIYISQATGYYEYELHKNIELTNEQIKKFESDIKDGKNVDITDYVTNTKKDYSTSFSKMGSNFSNTASKYIKKCIEEAFKFIESL